METVDNTTMHVTETKTLLCSSLNCPKTSKSDDITREKEEELLYGDSEDCEDDGTLSDDSIRLRVSDDEADERQIVNTEVSSAITKTAITEMESGSDVPTTDSSERKTALKAGAILANGKYTIESNLKGVDDVKREDNDDDFSHDKVTTNIENIYYDQEKCRNGDSDNVINNDFIGNSSNNKWHYSGRFGHYSRRGKRNSLPRQAYNMNTFNDKYYNQNTHYGRGRACGRGYGLYHTRESHVSFNDFSNDEKLITKVSTSDSVKNEPIDEMKTGKVGARGNFDDSRLDSSDSHTFLNNDTITKINEITETREFVSTNDTKSSEILNDNDNAKATSDSVNNVNSTSDEIQKNTLLNCDVNVPIRNCESNEIDGNVDEASNEVDKVESTRVDKNFDDAERRSATVLQSSDFLAKEKIILNKTNNVDEESSSNDDKNNEDVASEIINVSKNYDNVVSEETNESGNDEDEKSVNNEKLSTNEIKEGKNDEIIGSERINETKRDETIESEKIDAPKNSEKIINDKINECKISDNDQSAKTNESENYEDITLKKGNNAEKDETVASERIDDEAKNDETSESEERNETTSHETIESEMINKRKNDEILASDNVNEAENNEATIAEKITEWKNDETPESKEINESANHENSMEIPDEQYPTKLHHDIGNKQSDDHSSHVDNVTLSKETNVVESITKNDKIEEEEETSKESTKNCVSSSLAESLNESEIENFVKSVKSSEPISSLVPEECDETRSERATKVSSIVVTEPIKTIDEETVFTINNEITSETKVTLTDNDKSGYNDIDNDVTENKIDNNVTILHCSLKRTTAELLLDDMELSKRIRIGRKRSDDTSESGFKEIDSAQTISRTLTSDEIVRGEKSDSTTNVDNTVTNDKPTSPELDSEESIISNNVVEKSSGTNKSTEEKTARSETPDVDDNNVKIDDCEVIEVPVKRKHKRSRRSLNSLRDNVVSQEDSQERDNVRQKRKTAQNAEEIIRKEFLGNTDSESNDSLSKFVALHHKTSNNLRSASPPTLKRNYIDDEDKNDRATTKKLKSDVTINGDASTKNETGEPDSKKILRHVRNFFRRDANGSLCKLKQEELEEMLIQKVVETITMRDEIGKLREQAKLSERNQEATRVRCQQLAKQIKDFDMVLSRYKSDLRTNPDSKTVIPIKINRSVGLQVNFVTDHGIQNLRQLHQVQKNTAPIVNGTTRAQQHQKELQQKAQQQQQQQQQHQQQQQQSEQSTSTTTTRRSIKVRSPRRSEPPVAIPPLIPVSTTVNGPNLSTVTPAALVVSKPISDSRPSVTTTSQQTTVMHPQLISPSQTLLVNGTVTNQPIRQAPTLQASKAKNSDLIDLTQEEDKTKTTVSPQNTILTTALNDTSPSVTSVQKIAPRYHTVIQAIPGSMALGNQTGIRVVQPSSQPTPTALVNNMNAPRLTYVTMQGGIVPRQVVITSTPTPIRPAPANNIRTTFPISGTITNNTVRVIPATGTSTVFFKHPAALPESLNPLSNPSWKLPPPAPSLKISKVANGIVLSWNMVLSDKIADIASYQLYAYQEISGIAPSSTLWKKVGDVRALPLPMACTLTQFSEGNNYYFAVRAVDKHSRLGQYSQPGNISL